MDTDLKDAMRDWDREVSAEAARLIRNGVAPWPAMGQAVANVSRRRAAGGDAQGRTP